MNTLTFIRSEQHINKHIVALRKLCIQFHMLKALHVFFFFFSIDQIISDLYQRFKSNGNFNWIKLSWFDGGVYIKAFQSEWAISPITDIICIHVKINKAYDRFEVIGKILIDRNKHVFNKSSECHEIQKCKYWNECGCFGVFWKQCFCISSLKAGKVYTISSRFQGNCLAELQRLFLKYFIWACKKKKKKRKAPNNKDFHSLCPSAACCKHRTWHQVLCLAAFLQ